MDADDAKDTQFRKNLILLSAYIQTPPPGQRQDISSARVLRNALAAAGLWEDKLKDAFHGVEEVNYPIVTLWYSTLIEMTLQNPQSQLLLDGLGNLEGGAAAYFTGCSVTPAGKTYAEQLLTEQPQWKAKLTAHGK